MAFSYSNNNLSQNLYKAVYTDDIFITSDRPVFVYWNGSTKNTPFKAGLTDCQEGFAFRYGAWADYMTVVCFVKNDSRMWVWSKSRNEWVEYASKSDLSSFLDVSTTEYTVTLSAKQSTITSASATIKSGYTPLPGMLLVRTTGTTAVRLTGDNYYADGKIYVYMVNEDMAEQTIKVIASMLCYKS